jgi:uncharacterized protein YeaO (DUF488 family)
MVRIKRAYDPPARGDGYRVLVDRLWPRGVRKPDLRLAAWARELAPSDRLRRWFGHDPDRWKGFVARYRRELKAPAARDTLRALARRARRETVTIVYAARDLEHNDAVVLRKELERRRTRAEGAARRRAPAP